MYKLILYNMKASEVENLPCQWACESSSMVYSEDIYVETGENDLIPEKTNRGPGSGPTRHLCVCVCPFSVMESLSKIYRFSEN